MHTSDFQEVITSEAQFRRVIGHPSAVVQRMALPGLDAHGRAFLAACPFALIASADASGQMDVSPRGDPPGFVQVLDDTTIALPDRPGNRLAETLTNLVANPQVALLFMVPGKKETLRMTGTAAIVRDRWLRERMAVAGQLPEHAIVVSLRDVSFHCGKCMVRSRFWEPGHWPDSSALASLAQAVMDHARPEQTAAQIEAFLEKDARDRLY